MSSTPRLLILAQTPPPTHGQSVMVGYLVKEALRRDPQKFIHVNLRVSKDEQDVGTIRLTKMLLLAWCGLKALVACTLSGAREIYYVPSPAKRGSIIRDVFLLTLLKPFTRRLILHWHAVGLGEYTEHHPNDKWAQRLRRILHGHHMSICLCQNAAKDVLPFAPQSTVLVANGIPDPCPHFDTILAARNTRLAERQRGLNDLSAPVIPIHLLYLGLCTRSKGIFEVLATATALTAELNSSRPAFSIVLTIAGPFRDKWEAAEFNETIAKCQASLPTHAQNLLTVNQPGFTESVEKTRLLESADLFLFPTRYENEGLPLTLLEAMAFGLPIVSTNWRGIPEALPPDYPWLVNTDNLSSLAEHAKSALLASPFSHLRDWFLKGFTLEAHLSNLITALVGPQTESSIPLKVSF